jgi:hypothetical protein
MLMIFKRRDNAGWSVNALFITIPRRPRSDYASGQWHFYGSFLIFRQPRAVARPRPQNRYGLRSTAFRCRKRTMTRVRCIAAAASFLMVGQAALQ